VEGWWNGDALIGLVRYVTNGVMVVTRSKAEKYGRLAEECLAAVLTVTTEEARASLVAMAQVWQRLADEQNEGSDLAEVPAPPGATEQPQPVVQQQQQVQPKKDGAE
jgi:hypothetical protein